VICAHGGKFFTGISLVRAEQNGRTMKTRYRRIGSARKLETPPVIENTTFSAPGG